MTREERLEFCTICKHRELNFEKGLLCGITNQYAAFEDTCENYDEDLDQRINKFVRDLDASGHQNASYSLDYVKNKNNGALSFIIGLAIIIFSINYINRYGILILPLGLAIFGARTFLKGVEQEKVVKKNQEFESKKNQEDENHS